MNTYQPFQVQWWYEGRNCGTTTFGSEDAALAFKAALLKRFKAALLKRGVKLVVSAI